MYSFKSLFTKIALPLRGQSLLKWLLCLTMLGIMDLNIHNLSAQILYQESFENGAGGWTKVVGPFGRASSWELGTPSASVINSASEGTQAWATNLDGNHNFNEQSAVLGPNIDLSSAVNPIVSLDVYWETAFFQDGAFLEVSTNGSTFTRLGVDPDFYNAQAGFGGSNFVPAWTGSAADGQGSGGWVTVSADLSAFVGQTVRFRVVFRSAQDILGTGDTGLNGFAFDNVRVSNGVPSIKISQFPYAESFERSNNGWVSAPDFNFAVTNSWELQTPSGVVFFGASEGNYAWTTSATSTGGQDSYFDSELSQVLSPCFDFSALTAPKLSFDIWWESTFSLDGGALQYSTDNGTTWAFVEADFVLTDGVPGYNGIVFDDFGISELGFIPSWTGDAANGLGSDGYVPVEVDLSFLAGTPTVNFRFLFISDNQDENLDGIAFDNVKIAEASVVEPLAIAAIEDITVNTDAGVCSATVTLPEAVVTGGVAPVTVSNDAPATFELGETTVTYTATDANGTSVSTSFTVTVNDRENPVFAVCPQNIAASAPFGAAGVAVTYDAPEATDNCSALVIVTLLEGFDSGETFPIGETTVSYIAVDEAGNSAECTFTVTVTEGEPAELTIAAIEDITVSNDPGVCGATVSLPEAQVTGGEGEITVSNDAPATFPIGTTTVTYKATDAAGQTVSTSFDITINDTQAPVFTAGVDDLFLSTDAPSEIFLLDPVVSDNCPDATFELVGGLASGSEFPLGITKQSYEATDAAGNKTQACYNIGLLPLVQDLPYSQDFEAGNGGFASGSVGCNVANSWELSAGLFSTGAYEANENSFVVSPFFLLDEISLEEPTLSADVNFGLGAGDTIFIETSIDGGFEWNTLESFTGSGEATISRSLSSLLSGPGVAITLFRFRLSSDASVDNADGFSFDNFKIFDAVVAELTIAAIEDITVSNDPGVCGATVTLPEAVVTGGVEPIIVSDDAPATFPVGTTIVTITAIDGAGTLVSTSFAVTVNDTEAPVFTAGVDDLFLSTDEPTELFLLEPVANDNCPDVTFELVGGLASGSVFPLGITKQTYEATDASGNKKQACFNVGILPLIQDFPYSQDFEAGNGGFASGSVGCNVANSWELSAGLFSTGAYEANENSFVVSPFFLLDEISLEEPTLSADVNFGLGAGDTIFIETSIDGGFEWNTLESFTGSGEATISRSLSSLLSGPGVAITLFRFRLSSDASVDNADGFSFDNFKIFDAAATPQIAGFTLINSLTEGDIAPLNEGDVLVSNELPTNLINVRANVEGEGIGSVVFELSGGNLGAPFPRIENLVPYALFGDVEGNYNGESLKPGSYTLKATAYSEANGEGTVFATTQINFSVILNTTPQISEIVLYNADTDKEVAVLTDGAQIDLSQAGSNLTILARTTPIVVGSVKLALSGAANITRIENLAPYALFGDSNNGTRDLFGQAFTAGSYTITATAYAESNATGANSSQTVQFELVGGSGLKVYPNITSSTTKTTVTREGVNNSGKAIVLTITDLLGRVVGTTTIQVGKDSAILNLNSVPKGQYIISDGVNQTRMTVEN